eukprot:2100083-Ditylum_brightwellii.AAC.1
MHKDKECTGFSKEAIQLFAAKKRPIVFDVEEGADQKLGESRTYKLCMQPEEENSPMKQVLKEENIGNMDTAYTLVQDLLRGNTLTAFNNEQAMFKEHTLANFEHCLNAVMLHVFPNKAYKLQKQHMMHKPRHMSACKWIAKIIKLNNYLTEFPTSAK